MKQNKRNSTQILSRFLDRHFNASDEQVEAAAERALQRFEEQLNEPTFDIRTPAAPPAIVTRSPRAAWVLAVAFATIATALVMAFSAIWPTNMVMMLADGSRVEVRAGSETSVEPVSDGLRIRLNKGSIIVNAAKQAAGRHLYVVTRDVTVSVIGTVFLVKADDRGSHVAVIQGEVHVQQGSVVKNLRPGDQAASSPEAAELAMQVEIGWSREAAAYLAMMHQSVAQGIAARQSTPRGAGVSGPPQFEEAAIRRCEQDFRAPAGMRGGGSDSLRLSPGRLDVLCMTVATLIQTAYRRLENNQVVPGWDEPFFFDLTYGLGEENGVRVRGGPDWVRSEKYTISAVAPGRFDAPTIGGPMLFDLLERKFRLKVHVESEEIPVWALTVAKGGLKINPEAPGSCFRAAPISPNDEEALRRREQARGAIQLCGNTIEGFPPNVKLTFKGQTMRDLAKSLSLGSFRCLGNCVGPLSITLDSLLVLNKTGISDTTLFSFVMEYGADPGHFASMGIPADQLSGPVGPTIFEALDKLGLKLERSKGSREFVVIDQIERPSPN